MSSLGIAERAEAMYGQWFLDHDLLLMDDGLVAKKCSVLETVDDKLHHVENQQSFYVPLLTPIAYLFLSVCVFSPDDG